jgi:hypothetical protein
MKIVSRTLLSVVMLAFTQCQPESDQEVGLLSQAVGPVGPNGEFDCSEDGICRVNECDFDPDCEEFDPPADGDTPNEDGDTPDQDGDCASANYGFDIIKLPGAEVDFGDGSFVLGAPVGPGSVTWSVPDCDYYTARVVGTLHLDGASGKYARMYVSYWWGGEFVASRHGGTVRAPDNGHEDWSVDLAPFIGGNVDEVHVCTQISDDGVDFDFVNCKTRFL